MLAGYPFFYEKDVGWQGDVSGVGKSEIRSPIRACLTSKASGTLDGSCSIMRIPRYPAAAKMIPNCLFQAVSS